MLEHSPESPDGIKTAQSGSPEDLSPNQRRALTALIAHTTIAAAAEASGLSVPTLKRYLAEPSFARAYRQQQMILLSETSATLQRIAASCANVVEETLAPEIEDKALRLRAARTGLEFLLRTVETERKIREQEDLEERIEALERKERQKEFGV
jgi:hypothetical protein